MMQMSASGVRRDEAALWAQAGYGLAPDHDMEFGDYSASLDQGRDTGFDGCDGDGFCFRESVSSDWKAAPTSDHPQQRVIAHRQHQPSCKAGRWPATKRQTEVVDGHTAKASLAATNVSKWMFAGNRPSFATCSRPT